MSKMGKIIKIPKSKLITLSNKMYDDINIFKPDEIIICSELNTTAEIYEKLRAMNTSSFAYMFNYAPYNKYPDEEGSYLEYAFLKAGESNGYVKGERLVRQLRHLDGWNEKKPPYSCNGVDFKGGLERLIAELDYPLDILNKNNINIGIWSINDEFRWSNLLTEEDGEKAIWIEGELCDQHIKIYGKLPPLNIKDPSKCKIYTDPRMPNPNIRPVQFKVG
jgi:hypothetical protein